jgi:imidazolonepropionase-like amidohydrolase
MSAPSDNLAAAERLFEAGITLVAGTDTPNLLLIPGSALHDELRILVDEVGLSSFEALQTATTHAPAMLGRPTAIGRLWIERAQISLWSTRIRLRISTQSGNPGA